MNVWEFTCKKPGNKSQLVLLNTRILCTFQFNNTRQGYASRSTLKQAGYLFLGH